MLNGEEVASALAETGVDRFFVVPKPEAAALSGTSLDLRLGRWFLSFRQTQMTSVALAAAKQTQETKILDAQSASATERRRVKEYFVPFGQSYVLHPRAFVLGVTLEWLHLPSTLSAYVTGKSSLGRHGLIIETAAGIHPKFSGCLTLEIANVGEVPLEIFPGMVICQVFFHRTKARVEDEPSMLAGKRKPALGTPCHDETFVRLVRGERT